MQCYRLLYKLLGIWIWKGLFKHWFKNWQSKNAFAFIGKSVLNANNFVLYVINIGYLIPFFKDPTSAFKKKNNKSTLTYTSFAQTAI